jgi:sirohydrochlorin cobaltochelatase
MNPAPKQPALLLFAHGSSDPGWATPIERLVEKVSQRCPKRIVRLAYLERMQPDFDSAVDALQRTGVHHIDIAPIFIALGGHLRKDLPALIDAASARTGMSFTVAPALGEVDSLLDAIADWLAERVDPN